jgi:hypothetical protein
MGLDSTIRKISKAKVLRHIARPPLTLVTPLHKIPGYNARSNELGYWRNHRQLHRWMMELAREKLGALNLDAEALMNGAPILLNESDILRLKMEVVFGDLSSSYWEERIPDPLDSNYQVSEDIAVIDRMLRVSRRNRSYIFYTASW